MTAVVRSLGLSQERWSRVGPASLGSAIIRAAAASGVLALTRFGGLIVESPRAFTRMTLVGIYGWFGLAAAIWVFANILHAAARQSADTVPKPSFQHMLIAVGLAHSSLLVLGLVIFAAGGLFELLGPGLAAAVFVLGFWFPAALLMAARYVYRLSWLRAVAVVAVPYLIWLLVVGRHLMGQVQHLL